jgi:hypothetical protein
LSTRTVQTVLGPPPVTTADTNYGRPLRADAEPTVQTILEAAERTLGQNPAATMEDIAAVDAARPDTAPPVVARPTRTPTASPPGSSTPCSAASAPRPPISEMLVSGLAELPVNLD